MIKIHDKLWVVKSNRKDYGDSDLSYMTYHEDNNACEKRKETGRSWAKCGDSNPVESLYDNTPVDGMKIQECVGRWSTQNKVFRVRDPRGFVVEIPSGNLSTLLSCTTVAKSIVQEPCVWGREGNSHILLPVGSEPYMEAKEDSKTFNGMVTLGKLEPRDIVMFSVDDSMEYIFFGKVKITWKGTVKRAVEESADRWGGKYYNINPETDPIEEESLQKDTIWVGLFRSVDRVQGGKEYRWEIKGSGKYVKTGMKTRSMLLAKPEDIDVHPPERVLNKFDPGRKYYGWRQICGDNRYLRLSIGSFIYKEDKK